MSLYITLAFVYGCIIGSFLNVVIVRLHAGKGFGGRSRCMSCGSGLSFFELVPIVSYVVQRGRCRSCVAHIDKRYVLVELATGLLFALLAYTFPYDWLALIFYFVITSVLVVIFVYDARHTVIPDATIMILLVASVLFAIKKITESGSYEAVGYSLMTALMVSGVFALMWLLSRGKWFGLGDAKLVFPLAFILGPTPALSFIVLSFWIGTAYILAVAGIRAVSAIHNRFSLPRYTMRSEIPFGPFLVIAFFTVLFFHVDILAIIQTIADAATLKIYAWFYQ